MEEAKVQKMSKYAAKQARLASDPSFGTTYEVRPLEDVRHPETQAEVEKITNRIAVVTAYLKALEAKIERSKTTIEQTKARMDGQNRHAEQLRKVLEKLNARLSVKC